MIQYFTSFAYLIPSILLLHYILYYMKIQPTLLLLSDSFIRFQTTF